MSSVDAILLFKKYAEQLDQPADLMEKVLIEVSDARSIPIKIYGGGMDNHAEPRQVLDPQEISMENVMGVHKRVVSFQPGVTLLYGANGAGKTTTMRALLYALFGASGAGVRVAEDLIHAGQSQMAVDLKFAGGKVHRGVSRRVIKRGANAGSMEVEHDLTAQIAGDKADKAKAAQGLIDGWLGVDGAFVRRVCCLEQGALTQIMDEQPARRRDVFYRMLALEPCEETRKSLAAALQGEEDKLVRRGGELEALARERAALVHKRSTYPVEQLTAERARLAPEAAAAAAQPDELARYQQQLTRRQADRAEAAKKIADRKAYLIKTEELKRDPVLNVVHGDIAKDAALAEHALAGARESAVKAALELERLTKRGQELKSLPPVCPTCATIGKTCEVTPEVKEQHLATVRADWTNASKAAALAKGELELRQKAVDLARQAQSTAERDGQKQKFLLEQIAMLEHAAAQIPDTIDLHAIDADIAVLTSSIKTVEQRGNEQLVHDLRILDRALAEAAALDAQIASLDKKVASVTADVPMPQEEMDAMRLCVKAFAKDGLPLWLARQHLGRVNAIAAELCSLDRYRYSFGADLEILVQVGDVTIGPELACGSARERGAVVLMAALGRYLQELSGLSIPLLWIDELPFQDEANAHLVVEMVKRLTKWYPKVVLCASRWDEYLGQFDHEVGLLPEDVAVELERQRSVKAAHAADGQAQLAPPAPAVKTYAQAPQASPPQRDVIAEAEAALAPAPEKEEDWAVDAATVPTIDPDMEGCPF